MKTRILLSMAALLFSAGAAAQATPTLTLAALNNNNVPWGNHLMQPVLRATASGSCTSAYPGGTIELRAAGVFMSQHQLPAAACNSGSFSSSVDIPFDVLYQFGAHYSTVNFVGVQATSNPVFVTLRPDYNFITTGGTVFTSLATIASTCANRNATLQDREALEVDPPPPNLRTPFEHAAYASFNCTFALAPRPGPHAQYAQIELPIDIPAGAEVWVNDYGSDGAFRMWRRVVSPVIRGRQALFEVFGGGSGSTRQTFISATATIAIPQPRSRDLDLQDLWWGGQDQQGWGFNVAKNGERIFAALFAYQNDGRPVWVVMPQGTWDPIHEVYWGELYIPTGSSYTAYDASRFHMGTPVGVGSLSFSDPNIGRFDYTVNGFSGGKNLSRYEFATRNPEVKPPYAGMWWGGAGQDGWGVSIQQQGETLFATWYTYGPDGTPIWFYMPAGRRTAGNTYGGDLYRTTGARWFGAHYQGSSTQTIRVGTLQLAFNGNDSATMTSTVDGFTQSRPLVRFGF